MPRVIHFEVHADDPEKLADFYRAIFGWQVHKWGGPIDYWLVSTGDESKPGINGAIMHRREPSDSTTLTIDVPSIDEFLEKIDSSGGVVIMGKTVVPGVGYSAYCKDTQGNTFGLMQDDPNAE